MSEHGAEKAGGRRPDPVVDSRSCPACKSQPGEPCDTVLDGVQTHWTHDARFYADLAARIRATTPRRP